MKLDRRYYLFKVTYSSSVSLNLNLEIIYINMCGIWGKYIGLQIKPTTFEHTFEDYKWKEMQETSHRKFQEKFGGKVFIVFSVKEGKRKVIHNPEVIEEIRKEIERLEKE